MVSYGGKNGDEDWTVHELRWRAAVVGMGVRIGLCMSYSPQAPTSAAVQILKFGLRPSRAGGQEPFYILRDAALPPLHADGHAPHESDSSSSSSSGPAAPAESAASALAAQPALAGRIDGGPHSRRRRSHRAGGSGPPVPPQLSPNLVLLLRYLASGCMHPDPAQRMAPEQVSACAHVCVCVCVFGCVCVFVWLCVCIVVWACVYACKCACVCVCAHVHMS